MEVLDTEESYLSALHELKAKRQTFKENLTSDADKLVFGSVEELKGLSEMFLSSLRMLSLAWTPETEVGKLVVQISPFLKMYIPVANSYAQGSEVLEGLEAEGELDPQKHLEINNLRIQQIQRVPRYGLLLGSLLEVTDVAHPDYLGLKQALEAVTAVASLINERIKDEEANYKTLEIQSLLWSPNKSIPNLIQPGRRFLKEGHVLKVSSKGKLKKGFQLFCFSDCIVYGIGSPLNKMVLFQRSMDYYGAFDANADVERLGLKLKYGQSAFKVTGANGYRTFVVETESECREWMDTLNASILDSQEKRKSMKV